LLSFSCGSFDPSMRSGRAKIDSKGGAAPFETKVAPFLPVGVSDKGDILAPAG